MELKKQLLLSHLCICIIPIVIVTTIFFSILYRSAVNDATLSANQMIDQIGQNIESVLTESQKTATLLEHEISIQQALREPPSPFAPDSYAFTVRTNSYLNFIHSYSTTRLADFFILGDYVQYKSNHLAFNQTSYVNEAWYQEAKNLDRTIWITDCQQSFVNSDKQTPVITMVTPLHHTLEDRILGVTLIEIESDTFRKLIEPAITPSLTHIYITDAQGTAFLSSTYDDSEKALPVRRSPMEFSQPLSNGWVLHVSTSIYPTVIHSLFSMTTALVISLILILSVTIWFSVKLSKSISTPINTLMTSFKKVENGDFNVRVPIRKTNQEIDSMNASFNAMVEKLSQLLDQIISDQKALRKAQLTALQAQINPHFLYNTLDTIAWSIRLGRPDDALLALQSLTRLFRISISKGHDIITVEKEFEHVEKYLTIQKLRYSDKLDYSVCLPKELKDFSTLKLILQPLVENAIYHGIKNMDRPGRIDVRAVEDGEDITFIVHDNGAGMTPDVLEHLNSLLQTFSTADGKSFGVINVSTRIKMAYGPKYGIHYESVQEQYTTAYITIPKNHMADQADT